MSTMSGEARENGDSSVTSLPSKENGESGSVNRSPNESWCHVESSEESPAQRSQRRHFHDFNRSSVFDFTKSPDPVPTPREEEPSDPDSQANMEHKEKRHFQNKNQSTLDL